MKTFKLERDGAAITQDDLHAIVDERNAESDETSVDAPHLMVINSILSQVAMQAPPVALIDLGIRIGAAGFAFANGEATIEEFGAEYEEVMGFPMPEGMVKQLEEVEGLED